MALTSPVRFDRERAKPQAAKLRMPRFARYVVSRGWLHLILLCGVGIFVFPFVWMVGTSMKTDDEVTDQKWMPSIPTFVPRSPFVLGAPEVLRPMAVDPATWERLFNRLLNISRSAVGAELKARPSGSQVNADALRDSAAAVVMNRLVNRLPTKLWSGDDSALLDAYRATITPQIISEALADRLARFEIRGMLVRSLDAEMFSISDGKDVAKTWQVESGDAKIVTAPDGTAFLQYDFASRGAKPIVLRRDFEFPFDPSQLHKLIVSYKADTSWHRLDCQLTIGGQVWETIRPSYLAQARPSSIMLQPPTFEDEAYKNKVWTPIKLVSSGPSSDPRKASLRVTLSPEGTIGAILAKVQFNYRRALNAVPFWKYVRNSTLLVALCVLGTWFSSTFVAYAFARLHWPGRSVAFVLLLSTMMLPSQVTMIPSFMIWRAVGWYNTLNPLWVPAFLGSAFFIFLMVQQMRTIPRDLEEAARIDGLNAFQTWWYIIVPLVKPTAAAIAIMTAMGAWNEFMGPLIYLRDQAKFPLSLGLFGIRADFQSSGIDWTMIMAGNVLMTLPVIVMFLLFQKYFVQGMTMSGMKG